MEQKFIERFINAIDTEDEINMETVLNDMEDWDSLSFVSFIAMANTAYQKNVVANDVRKAKTVRDLYKLIRG